MLSITESTFRKLNYSQYKSIIDTSMKLNKDPLFLARIENALDQLRPYLQADSGNVSLVEVTDDMVVKLKLLGACSSCSMSMMTLKAGIEQSLLRAVPEIQKVESVTYDTHEELLMKNASFE